MKPIAVPASQGRENSRAIGAQARRERAASSGSQMETVSWGKEEPKSLGHDESAWAENRRADMVYPKQ